MTPTQVLEPVGLPGEVAVEAQLLRGDARARGAALDDEGVVGRGAAVGRELVQVEGVEGAFFF